MQVGPISIVSDPASYFCFSRALLEQGLIQALPFTPDLEAKLG